MVVISVSLSGEELASFDRLVEHMGYDSRSSAVRDALFSFIQEHRVDFSAERMGLVVTLIYAADRGQEEVQELVHREGHLVQTLLHQHVGERCVDLLVLEGAGQRLHEVLDTITAIKDVRVTVTPL